MRQKKNPDLKAKSVMVTMPNSYHEFMTDGNLSRFVQIAIAEKVTGVTYKEFLAHQNPYEDTRVRRDPWEQEFLRMARWMLEGKVIGVSRQANPDWLFLVKWNLTNETTLLRMDYRTSSFNRVVYDEVEKDQEELDNLVSETNEYGEFADEDGNPNADIYKVTDCFRLYKQNGFAAIYSMNPLKAKILARWAELSGWKVEFNPIAACGSYYKLTVEGGVL